MFRRLPIGRQVELFDLLPDDPVGHGIDVVADDVAADPVGFDQRGAASHEGVGDPEPRQVIGPIKGINEGRISEFGEEQAPEQGPRPPGKPLVNGDKRPVVLLDLLLPQSQTGNKRDVEILFNGHGWMGKGVDVSNDLTGFWND